MFTRSVTLSSTNQHMQSLAEQCRVIASHMETGNCLYLILTHSAGCPCNVWKKEASNRCDRTFYVLQMKGRRRRFDKSFVHGAILLLFSLHYISVSSLSVCIIFQWCDEVFHHLREGHYSDGTSWAKTSSFIFQCLCLCKMETFLHIIWHDYFAHSTGYCLYVCFLLLLCFAAVVAARSAYAHCERMVLWTGAFWHFDCTRSKLHFELAHPWSYVNLLTHVMIYQHWFIAFQSNACMSSRRACTTQCSSLILLGVCLVMAMATVMIMATSNQRYIFNSQFVFNMNSNSLN